MHLLNSFLWLIYFSSIFFYQSKYILLTVYNFSFLRPVQMIHPKDRPARQYSPFGTRSVIYVNHQLVWQHKARIVQSIVSTDVPERMQALIRNGLSNVFRGITNQGKSQVDQLIKNIDIKHTIHRRTVGADEKWVKLNDRRVEKRMQTMNPKEMKIQIDTLNETPVSQILHENYVASSTTFVGGEGDMDGLPLDFDDELATAPARGPEANALTEQAMQDAEGDTEQERLAAEDAEEERDDAAEAAVVEAERTEAWENVEINGGTAV
jgi:hypothetical protein